MQKVSPFRLPHFMNRGFFLKVFLLSGFTVSVILGTVIRFWDLNRQSLWQDEIHTALYIADHPTLWEVIRRVATWDIHSPLFYILLWFETQIYDFCGIPLTDGNLRLISALLGSLALPIIYILFKSLYKKHGFILMAVFIAALNIYGIYYSQELRMYAAILFLAPAILYFQLNLWDDNSGKIKKKNALGYIASSALLLYSSLIGSFFIAGTGVALLIVSWVERKHHPDKWIQAAALLVIIFIAYSPWLATLWHQSMMIKEGVWTGLIINKPREIFKFSMENLLLHVWHIGPGFDFFGKLTRIIIPLALLNLLDNESGKKHGFILLGFAFTFIIYFFLTFNKAFNTGRYFAAWWPWAIYLVVAGFSGIIVLIRKVVPRFRWAGFTLAIIFCGYYAWVQSQQIFYYFTTFEKENYRAAAKYINSLSAGNNVILVKNTWYKQCFTYYKIKLPLITLADYERDMRAYNNGKVIYIGGTSPEKDVPFKKVDLEFRDIKWDIRSLKCYVSK